MCIRDSLQPQQDADREGCPGPCQNEKKSRQTVPKKDGQRGADQRHDDLQDGEMLGEAHFGDSFFAGPSSMCRISSSSMVPYSSRMRTANARPRASVATPTTIAVRIRTVSYTHLDVYNRTVHDGGGKPGDRVEGDAEGDVADLRDA